VFKYQEVDNYSGYLTITTRSIKQGDHILVNYGDDYFPKCVCDTCAGPTTPRIVGKATDNRLESMEGTYKRKRKNNKERQDRRNRNRVERRKVANR
jgi:hypothetical protein